MIIQSYSLTTGVSFASKFFLSNISLTYSSLLRSCTDKIPGTETFLWLKISRIVYLFKSLI